MSLLARLEEQILSLHGRLSLTPTLVQAAKIGELLSEAKASKEIPHGQFLHWVRSRCRISPRLSQTYMQIADTQNISLLNSEPHLTIDQFLRKVRQARFRKPDPPPEHLACMVPTAKVFHADSTKFKKWGEPGSVDLIITDPPWLVADHYRWLSDWAPQILRDGGVLLCQCGTQQVGEYINLLEAGGLKFHWILALVYPDAFRVRPAHGFASCWRPVLMFVKGKFDPGKVVVSDTMTVKPGHEIHKNLHKWQQPLAPIAHWTLKLTSPGAKIVDPFAGSGTTAIATLKAGEGRTWLGCDVDPKAVRIARKRIKDEVSVPT